MHVAFGRPRLSCMPLCLQQTWSRSWVLPLTACVTWVDSAQLTYVLRIRSRWRKTKMPNTPPPQLLVVVPRLHRVTNGADGGGIHPVLLCGSPAQPDSSASSRIGRAGDEAKYASAADVEDRQLDRQCSARLQDFWRHLDRHGLVFITAPRNNDQHVG